MDIDQLRYFLQTAERGSFTGAAEELGISQPALSRSVQRLEMELGLPVFVRKTKSIELTEAGELLRERAQQILSLVDDTKAEICDDGKSGRIRVGSIPTIAPYLLPPFLKSFADEFPDVSVVIHEETTDKLIRSCIQGDVDLAVLAMPVPHAKYLSVEALADEELFLVLPCDDPLVDKKKIHVQDVRERRFVMLDEHHCLSNDIASFCHRKSFQPAVTGKTNQLSMVQELVSLSHGISLVPRMARDVDSSDRRVYRSFSGDRPMRHLALAWDPYRYQSKVLTAFREKIKDHAAQVLG